MSELFRWHIQFPEARTLSKRAEECRRLAKLGPEYSREDYLKLAADYEQLATETSLDEHKINRKPHRNRERQRGQQIEHEFSNHRRLSPIPL